MAVTPRVLEYDVSVDHDRTAKGGRGGDAISADEAWAAEHLVLAGLVRCTLSSLDYSAGRAGVDLVASGRANGAVTKRCFVDNSLITRPDYHWTVSGERIA